MKTIILAGGYAKRLWPLTLERPKPLLPVAGRPIIEHLLARLPQDRPILSTNRRFAPLFERWLSTSPYEAELAVEETRSEEEKLGTVGAIAYLIGRFGLDEDLLIVGGDNILELDFPRFISAYHGRPLLALYDIGDLDKVRGRYGVALVEGDKIIDFQEKPEEPRSTLVSTACYIYPPAIFPLIEEFLKKSQRGQDAPGYLNQWLLQRGVELDPFIFRDGWFDIGDRSSYIAANLHYLDDDLYLGKNVRIDHSTVRRSVILDHVSIKDSLIEDSVVGEGAELVGVELCGAIVGAGTRLRRD